MYALIIKGIIAGIGISLLIGPLFFGLIQLSIERGFWAGIIFACGIWLSDLLYINVIQFGLSFLGENPAFQLVSGIGGSVLLAAFGVGIYLSPLKTDAVPSINLTTGAGYFLKGAAINIFNPFVFFLWVSILSNLSREHLRHQWVFLGSLLIVVALTDILKAAFASKLSKRVDAKLLGLIKKISGMILFVFGIVLLVRTLMLIL